MYFNLYTYVFIAFLLFFLERNLYIIKCILGAYHLLSIISNDYLAHCVEMVELDTLIKNWEENLESEGKDKILGEELNFPTTDATELSKKLKYFCRSHFSKIVYSKAKTFLP